jgi:putative mycofactocin binding protein MftB
VSTELPASGAGAAVSEAGDQSGSQPFDPGERYQLSRDVSLRPESFGALAYHFGNRRLSFLKTPRLVEIVESLREHESVRAALSAHGVPDGQRADYLHALAALAHSAMIVRY